MPHSPRVAHGRLWLLEGGTGWLTTADPARGTAALVAVGVPVMMRRVADEGDLA